MRLPQLKQRLRDLGAAPFHEGCVLRAWLQERSLDTKRRHAEDYFPLALRDGLPGFFNELQGLARVQTEHAGEDGSSRLLVKLADGQTVESALLPRDGLCHSGQSPVSLHGSPKRWTLCRNPARRATYRGRGFHRGWGNRIQFQGAKLCKAN